MTDSVINRSFFTKVEWLIGLYGTGLLIIFITSLEFTEIILRKIFTTSLYGLEEWVSLAMIFITFLPISAAEKEHRHIRMDFIVEKFGPKIRSKVQIVSIAILLMGTMVLTVMGFFYVKYVYLSGAVTPLREWQLWPFYLVFPFGVLMVSIRVGVEFINKLKNIGQITG